MSYNLTPDELRKIGLAGLRPLLLLTKGGATQEIAEEVISGLEKSGKKDSLAATLALASLTLTSHADQQWLARRIEQMYETMEESWVIQRFMEKARQQEREKLEEEERKKEEQYRQSLRELLIGIVATRFSSSLLTELARKIVGSENRQERLQQMILKVGAAGTAEQAQAALLTFFEEQR